MTTTASNCFKLTSNHLEENILIIHIIYKSVSSLSETKSVSKCLPKHNMYVSECV